MDFKVLGRPSGIDNNIVQEKYVLYDVTSFTQIRLRVRILFQVSSRTSVLTDGTVPRLTHVTLSPVCAQTPPMGARGHRTRADLPCLYTHLCGGALDAGHRCVRCMPRSHVTAAA